MAAIAENLLVMVLSVLFLLGGGYLLLLLMHMWLKFKSGSREQEGLTDLLITAQRDTPEAEEPEYVDTARVTESDSNEP